MNKKFLMVLFLFSISFSGCELKNTQPVQVDDQDLVFKTDSEHPDHVFIASTNHFKVDKNIVFLEKEFVARLHLENRCLSVQLRDENNKNYLMVLNKGQSIVKDEGNTLKGIKDHKTGKVVELNHDVVLLGVAFDRSAMQPQVKIPPYCPKDYIMTGGFR